MWILRTKPWHRVKIVARLHPFREQSSPDLRIPRTKPWHRVVIVVVFGVWLIGVWLIGVCGWKESHLYV